MDLLEKYIKSKDLTQFCRKHKIIYLAVFGSVARQEQNSNSDIDFIVKYSIPISLLKHVQVQQELSDIIGREVDLLTLEGIHASLKDRIIASQKVVYEEAG